MSTTTITMPGAIESAITEMCADAVTQAVAVLSTKYGFDAAEAQRDLNLGKLKIKGSATKASSKNTATADKPKTKRGLTGYLLYTKELRPEVTAEMQAELGDGEKLKPQNVVTAMAARWKALGDDEKAEWSAKAKSQSTSDDEADAPSSTPASPKAEPKKEPKKEAKKEPKKEAKKEPKKEAKKDTGEASDAPKKRQNGYLLFGKEMRAAIKEELEANLDEGEKLKPHAVVQEIAAQWKALDKDEQAEWNEKASTPPPSGDDTD